LGEVAAGEQGLGELHAGFGQGRAQIEGRAGGGDAGGQLLAVVEHHGELEQGERVRGVEADGVAGGPQRLLQPGLGAADFGQGAPGEGLAGGLRGAGNEVAGFGVAAGLEGGEAGQVQCVGLVRQGGEQVAGQARGGLRAARIEVFLRDGQQLVGGNGDGGGHCREP
jgi:hypothetical protein